MSPFRIKLSPSQRIIISFLFVILTGSILLSLPISQISTSTASYWDHLFTSVSMVCVTGLFTKAVAETYSTFGQIICMMLIQIGGLSLIGFIGLFALRGGRKMNFINMATLQEALNRSDTKYFRSFLKSAFGFTLAVEAFGALLLSFHFVPEFGWARGLFTSIFVAISAFCNAGFDNFGATSIMRYVDNPLINLTLASLIIMGGLGFSVWFDLQTQIGQKRSLRKLGFHTKIVLGLTAIILTLGTLTTLLTEWNNPSTIGQLSFGHKLLASFFQTVTMRTAGFASIDYTKAEPITLLLYIFQMMLGGAPGGTAGGIKITAFLTLVLYARSEILGLPHTNFMGRTIDNLSIRKAFATFSVFLLMFIIGLFALALTDDRQPLLFLMFEVMSALATIGVTANLTPSLTMAGQAVIMALMFFGRIGPLSILASLSVRKLSKTESLQYAKSSMLV
ncbi:TPA: TrkH family potassium uptake protein [Streptococcus suis]|uniref:TrkH family potassium uptake protein n=1 Tax=Streptococcus suis TaxID=1307 RepID=UPI00209C0B1D|nr:potassium transporter TrkG [Streptococcus suis]MCO8209364.1 TrkH family potassium uptake protein [Streptococcus suis]HEM3489298.1 TrkH family potassium uptake protein [Streptococcus suis]